MPDVDESCIEWSWTIFSLSVTPGCSGTMEPIWMSNVE